MHTELHYLSLTDAARLVKARLVSPVELTRAMLDRIAVHDPALHSFITVTAEEALAQARQAEQDISRGHYRGPLHGIPIAYKDNIETKGVRTTANSRALADHVPLADAEVVVNLARAGAVSLGKLGLPELAFGSPGSDDLYPAPLNPWNLAHSAGASSSGPAAAVAAGFAFATVGTDTGGSIRHPAALCGAVGLKPTFGRVSTAGIVPLSVSQDHVGPLTRTVADNAAMLQAMCSSFARGPRSTIASTRIGVPARLLEEVGLSPEVRAAFDEALDTLKAMGASIIEVPSPKLADVNTAGTRIILMEAWAQYGAGVRANPQAYGEEFRTRVAKGEALTAAERDAALAMRAEIGREHERLFAEQVDIIVSPAREEPAVTMAQFLGNPLGVRGQLTRVYNLARVPALVMPMGFSAKGLPLSLQLAAGLGQESRLYDVAEAFEQASGWTHLHPAPGA